MNLLDIINAAQGRICGGSEYQWRCFGPDARFLDFADSAGLEVIDIVFDSKNQTVYEVSICPAEPSNDHFIWINPAFRDNVMQEAQERKVDLFKSYDNIIVKELLNSQEVIDLIKKAVSN